MSDDIFTSEAWRRAVAALRYCVLCDASGVQAAHRNEGKGKGLKVDDSLTAALCTDCHTYIDQGAQLSREMRRELLDRAIIITLMKLTRAGYVGVTPTGIQAGIHLSLS